MAGIFSFLLLVVLASGSLASAPTRPASALDTYIIVIKEKFRARRGSTGPTELFMRMNLRANNTNSLDPAPTYVRRTYYGFYFYLGIGYIADMNITAINTVRNFTDIDFIESDAIGAYRPTAVKWHLDRIDQRDLPLDKGYNPQYTGQGVDIYIIDSGIRYSHQEFLTPCGVTRASYGGFDPVQETEEDGEDLNGHGTHVAALAAGETVGAAKGANVYSVKVFDINGFCPLSRVVKAIEHVVDKAEISTNRVIMSMSLGGPVSWSMNECVRIANTKGVITVAAAGNDGDDACNLSPASAEYAITVGATRKDDCLPNWTNYGKCVDIFAPGNAVCSASHSSDTDYVPKSGTSMAAPIVSGVVAMLLVEDPSLTPQQVKAKLIMKSSEDKLDQSSLSTGAQLTTPNRLVYV